LRVNGGAELETMAWRLGELAAASLAAMGFALAAGAQGNTLAVGGSPTVIHALNVAALSMLIPVVLVILGILLLVVRRARRESVSG
jgi:hypothetical protein